MRAFQEKSVTGVNGRKETPASIRRTFAALPGIRIAKNVSSKNPTFHHTAVILRSRALARRLEGWPRAPMAHPSRLAARCGEHLRMTAVLFRLSSKTHLKR